VVNMDDAYSPDWLKKLTDKTIIRVSLNNLSANCFAQDIGFVEDQLHFLLHINGESIDITLKAEGEHNVRNALMAAACAYAAGAGLLQIQQGLKNFSPVSGRLKQFVGVNGAQVIDDSYNANPGSVRAAIDVLAKKSSQNVLVLGDLGELGPSAAKEHTDLGFYAKDKHIKQLFTVGKLTQETAKAFGEGAMHFSDQSSLVSHLKKIATANTTFLIKGSRSAAMDLVVKELVETKKNNQSCGDLY
jgi:UDP-N-acetylmuramoyl-tripeptide--D-alanyl-D-alanine ligase